MATDALRALVADSVEQSQVLGDVRWRCTRSAGAHQRPRGRATVIVRVHIPGAPEYEIGDEI